MYNATHAGLTSPCSVCDCMHIVQQQSYIRSPILHTCRFQKHTSGRRGIPFPTGDGGLRSLPWCLYKPFFRDVCVHGCPCIIITGMFGYQIYITKELAPMNDRYGYASSPARELSGQAHIPPAERREVPRGEARRVRRVHEHGSRGHHGVRGRGFGRQASRKGRPAWKQRRKHSDSLMAVLPCLF